MKSEKTDEDKYKSENIGGTLCFDHEKLSRILSRMTVRYGNSSTTNVAVLFNKALAYFFRIIY